MADVVSSHKFAIYDPSMAVPEAGEDELARDLCDVLVDISRRTWEDNHLALRSVHAKSHGILSAKLAVLHDLPAELAQGIFAAGGTYDVVARLSTTPGDLLSDKVSTPRGFALKLLDVKGSRLEDSEDRTCQDFIFVDGPQFNAPNGKAFLRSLKLLAKTTDRAPRAKELLSAVLRGTERAIEAVGGESPTVVSMGGHAATDILGETFFTQLPMRYGEHIAKLQLVPMNDSLKRLRGAKIDLDLPDALREMVNLYFSQHEANWELRAQLSTNLDDMPINDATAKWDEEQSPFRTIARLTAPVQVGWNVEKSKHVDEGMAFSPWDGIEEHRPLGDIMRLRKTAYAASQKFRSEKSGCPFRDQRI